jgi:hypothetical protein
MAAIDRHDINTKIIAALRADAAVVALLGASPGTRIYSQMKRSVTFPFVRMDFVPVGPLTGVMTGSGIDWARQHTVQFTAFSQSPSLAEVCDVQKAIVDVMDYAPTNVVLTTGTVFMVIPGAEFADFDPENGTSFSVCEFTLSIDSN